MNSTTLDPDEILQSMIIQDEGFIKTMYKDTEGFHTIGIGFCLEKITMPEKVARLWLNEQLDNIYEQLEACEDIYKIFITLDDPRQLAIINMCYQLGIRGVHGFRNMWGALKIGDYEEAALEAKDSLWYTQTPNRAERVAEVIRSGSMAGYNIER